MHVHQILCALAHRQFLIFIFFKKDFSKIRGLPRDSDILQDLLTDVVSSVSTTISQEHPYQKRKKKAV